MTKSFYSFGHHCKLVDATFTKTFPIDEIPLLVSYWNRNESLHPYISRNSKYYWMNDTNFETKKIFILFSLQNESTCYSEVSSTFTKWIFSFLKSPIFDYLNQSIIHWYQFEVEMVNFHILNFYFDSFFI